MLQTDEPSRTRVVLGVQAPNIDNRPWDALSVIQATAARAAEDGADIVCFPEGFLNGYTRERREAEARAVTFGSTKFAAMLDSLKNCLPVLIIGVIEERAGLLYNSAVVVERGRLVGTYRKRHPNEDCFEPGDELPVFDIAGMRVGIGICADARDYDDASRLASERVDVVVYLLNNMLPSDVAYRWRERHIEILTERAVQIGAWVISADVIGQQKQRMAYGCTASLDPHGDVIERTAELQAGVATAVVPVKIRPALS